MFALRWILPALLGLVLAACGPSAADRDRLDRAEAIVHQYPDSALAILDSITTAARGNNRFNAQATVVNAEACYKLQRPLPSDSVFTRTITVLSQYAPDSYLSRAYFLNGYRKSNEGRYIDAIVDFLSAEEIAAGTDDIHYTGLAQRNIADAFDNLGDKESSLSYYRRSADTFRADPDSGYYYWGLYNVARSYNNALKYDQAIALADSLASLQQVKDNGVIYPHVISLLALANLNTHRNKRALELYKQLQSTDYSFTAGDYNNLGTAYLNLGKIDEARTYSDSVKALDPTDTSLDFAIACKTKDTTNIFDLIDNDFEDTNSEFESLYRRNYTQIIDEYYSVALDKRQNELRRNQRNFATFIILTLILLAGLTVIYVLTVKRKQRRIAQTLGIVAELSKSLDNRSEEIRKLEAAISATTQAINQLEEALSTRTEDITKLESNLKARDEDISKLQKSLEARNEDLWRLQVSLDEVLCKQAENSQNESSELGNHLSLINEVGSLYSNSGADPIILYKNVERLISRTVTKKKTFEIEKHLNESRDNIVARFRADFPQLKESDVQLFTLTVAGLQAAAVALFLKVDVGSVYTRRFRLRNKIMTLNAEAAAAYENYLA